MRAVMIEESVNSVAAGASIDLAALGIEYGAGRHGVLEVSPEVSTANQVGDLQQSDDDSSFSDLQAYAAADGHKVLEVALSSRYLRINNESGVTGSTNFLLRQ